MIPAKNFFSGALGKTKNIGGSQFFTTPHTVDVKENYSIKVKVDSKCLTCSLDGKLWLFENSVVALKWNNEKKRLELAASKNIEEKEKFITRGLDWILTDKSIYLVTDEETEESEEPEKSYIFSKILQEDTSAQRVLYSVLRSSVLSEVPRNFTTTAGSGIDPFTQAAWGMNENNGNSEGWGFFNKDNFLLYPEGSHDMEQCYSLLPKVGDWQIVENFLIRRPDNPLENQPQLAPLIPLEFNGYMLSRSVTYPTYGTGYNLNHRGIQLFIHNGELWARGLMHIGKVFILPAVFHEDGTIKDYYLYISPEYILSPYNQRTNPNMDANDDWLKLNFISTKDNELLGFTSEQNNGLCGVSSDKKVFHPDTNEWVDVLKVDEEEGEKEKDDEEEEGKIFFDNVNSSALFLGTKSIKFLSNDKSFTCKALSQWISPANQVESVSDDLVISSFDNHTLATCIPTGFNRELLSERKLYLSAKSIDDKRFSMGFSDGNITVNEVASQNINIPSDFNIFKKPVDIRILNIFSEDLDKYGEWQRSYPVWFPGGRNFKETKWIEAIQDTKPWQWVPTTTEKHWDEDDFVYATEITSFYYWINPNTGEFKKETVTLDITPYIGKTMEDVYNELREEYAGEDVDYWSAVMMHEGADYCCYYVYAVDFTIVNNQIGADLRLLNNFDDSVKYSYVPYVSDLPTEIKSWGDTDNNGLTLDSICYPCNSVNNAISKKLPCCLNAIFNEAATNTKFAYEIPSWSKIDDNGDISGALPYYYGSAEIYNYGNTESYKRDYRNRNRSMSNLHVLKLGGQFIVFRSDFNPDTFDFDNELLRSVVS